MVKGRTIPTPKPTTGTRVGTHDAPTTDWQESPPAFCLRYMVAAYSVDSCNKDEKAALADAMWRRSRLTWKELRSAHRHGLGGETIKSINRPRPSVVTEDVTLLAFRFSGPKAMVGFRVGRIFHVIWLDHDFTVYDH
jgi:hypothetical protein